MRRSSFLSPMNNGFLHRRSITYCRLPQQLLKLTILKLDGSSFEVHVARTASVLELKQAVEDIFSPSPEEEDQGQISWSHVWGHFCLCFKDNKLLDDRLSMGTLGIQDGDQLHFIRHLSVNCSPIASIGEREKNADFKQQPL